MDFYDKRIIVRYTAASIFIAFLMYTNGFLEGSAGKIALNSLILATLVSRVVWRRFWGSKRMSIAFVLLAGLETAAGMIWYDEKVLIYFYSIIVVTTVVRLTLGPNRVPFLAYLILIGGLFAAFGEVSWMTAFSFTVISIFFYFNVRSRRQRDAIFEENKRHLAELQVAYAHLQEASVASMRGAVLDERTRIARDIHDAVGHSLTSLIVQLQAMRYMIAKDPGQAERSVSDMLDVARQGLQDIRTSVHSLADDRSVSGLAPLRALLTRIEKTSSLQIHYKLELEEDDVSAPVSTLLFGVMQEALTNLVRHAEATVAKVKITRNESWIVLLISDNGQATAGSGIQEGFGLKMMRSRLEEAGGRLSFGTAEPSGFWLQAELPVDAMTEAGIEEGMADERR